MTEPLTRPATKFPRSRPAAPEAPAMADRRGVGILLVVAGAMTMSMIDGSAKWLVGEGLPQGQIVFIRFLLPCAVLALVFLPSQGLSVMRTRSLKLEVLRSLCMVGTTATNFMALKYLPLTITGSIMFSSPLILCLLSGVALGERVDWQRWLAVLTGFAAILIIIRPDPASLHPAMLYSVAMAVLMAFYAILTRKLAGVDSSLTQQCYISFTGFAFALPFAFQGWTWPHTPAGWFACVLIGLAGLVGHTFYSIAHRFAPATTLAPFTYAQLVFMALGSWLVFAQAPDIYFFIGLPILIGSGIYIWFRELSLATRRKRAAPEPVLRQEAAE
ncbi:DMT family transporter [Pseudochelatococcus lubricantis]|uniref:DMT family transporter n=1 Tax=Pseudochelatococcus lubricantis TaxID=1538102 RepID=UPI0035EEDDC4